METLILALSWVGSNDFGHEALRRGEATPPFTTVSGSALEGNVLRGVTTTESIGMRVTESGVPLDEEQRQVLSEIKLPLQRAALCDSIGRRWENSPRSLPPERLLGSEPRRPPPTPCSLLCVYAGLA